MRVFLINENEINALATWNQLVTAAVGVGSFAFAQFAAIVLMLANSPTLTAQAEAIQTFGLPFFGLMSLASFGVAAMLVRARRTLLSVVKDETESKLPRTAS